MVKEKNPQVLYIKTIGAHEDLSELLDDFLEMLTVDLHHPHTMLKTVSYYSQLPSITVCGEDEIHVVPNPLASLLPSPDSKDGHAGSLSPKESRAITEFMEKFAKEYMLTLKKEFNEEKEITVVAICKLPKPVEDKALSNNTDNDPFSAVFGVLGKRKDTKENIRGMAAVLVRIDPR